MTYIAEHHSEDDGETDGEEKGGVNFADVGDAEGVGEDFESAKLFGGGLFGGGFLANVFFGDFGGFFAVGVGWWDITVNVEGDGVVGFLVDDFSEFFRFVRGDPACHDVGAVGFAEESFSFFEEVFVLDEFFPSKEEVLLFGGVALEGFLGVFLGVFVAAFFSGFEFLFEVAVGVFDGFDLGFELGEVGFVRNLRDDKGFFGLTPGVDFEVADKGVDASAEVGEVVVVFGGFNGVEGKVELLATVLNIGEMREFCLGKKTEGGVEVCIQHNGFEFTHLCWEHQGEVTTVYMSLLGRYSSECFGRKGLLLFGLLPFSCYLTSAMQLTLFKELR